MGVIGKLWVLYRSYVCYRGVMGCYWGVMWCCWGVMG